MTVIDEFALMAQNSLFDVDIRHWEEDLTRIVSVQISGSGRCRLHWLICCKEIFRRNPVQLDVLDISETASELVRDLRSSLGYIKGEFRTFAL